ncbi:iron complex outermembrane recepter protein [Solimonas aquatica]|uniref:Iron complex outermembrane recepter protein n=1 Tax=Solimonas aquatica TaxID=489703 RepID=A0A1H8ZYP5_9GAMM|nr:TonB-dependent copper receptor [Solimonas aquatica]SEP69371.1 iron complex outermembrane recepter protein [Solimonas aquatica]
MSTTFELRAGRAACTFVLTPLALAAALYASRGVAAERDALEEVIVSSPRMSEPLQLNLDAKAPQQPVPANDGASYLKNVPGFSMIRKGGTDGDPVLRGLAGSRLNLLVDGAELLGGCGMRMDPPTAYVFPEAYDLVTVIKGPQTVRYGNGNLAGVVSFERDPQRQRERGLHADASLLAGSWQRLDSHLDLRAAGEQFYGEAIASYADAEDYQDGAGRRVHSAYTRKNATGLAGWQGGSGDRIELSAVSSSAEAAYADRSMDGVKFDRIGYNLRYEREQLGPLRKLKAQLYYTDIDHVMDNFSLRTRTAMMYMVGNPKRETQGFRLSSDLPLGEATLLNLGLDHQQNIHSLRKYSAGTQAGIGSYAWGRDMDAHISGAYAELRQTLSPQSRLLAGARYDAYLGKRSVNAYGGVDAQRSDSLKSGFLRYEQQLAQRPVLAYLGLGHAERPLDYWEATTYAGLLPTAQLAPEKLTQLDTGALWRGERLRASLSAFYGRVDDYLLTASTALGASCAAGLSSCAYNVDVTRWGGEADLAWALSSGLNARGALAYVHAQDQTQHNALAQTPPLDGRVGLDYRHGPYSIAGTWRLVAAQHRVQPGYGNVVGQDLGQTAGFTTLALNLAWQPTPKLLASAGVDNVLDRAYAEHLSRGGSAVAGYPTASRVYEPGRFFWARLKLGF